MGLPRPRAIVLVVAVTAAALFVAMLVHIPGAFELVGTPLIAAVLVGITVYVAFVWFVDVRSPSTAEMGAALGLLAGVLFVGTICVENFVAVPRALNVWVTLSFMLAIFASFGAAGYKAYRCGLGTLGGLTASLIAGATGVLVALNCGFLLNVVAAPRLLQNLGTEAAQHHLAPTLAFTALSSAESAATHLVEAPVIASSSARSRSGSIAVGIARATASRGGR